MTSGDSPEWADVHDRTGHDQSPGEGGVRVEVDGQTVEYYPAGVELPASVVADLRRYEYRVDVVVDHHPRLRRAAVWFRPPGDVVRIFGALHWADGRDLDALDRALRAGNVVRAGGAADAFDGALFTVVSDVTCAVCHSSSLVAAVDSVLPLATPERERQHPTMTSCPVCGAGRFRPHVEVLAT